MPDRPRRNAVACREAPRFADLAQRHKRTGPDRSGPAGSYLPERAQPWVVSESTEAVWVTTWPSTTGRRSPAGFWSMRTVCSAPW